MTVCHLSAVEHKKRLSDSKVGVSWGGKRNSTSVVVRKAGAGLAVWRAWGVRASAVHDLVVRKCILKQKTSQR